MNKTQLINALSDKSGFQKKDTEVFLNAFTEVITESLVEKERVQITGFGTFDVTERAERMGRNPQTGEPLKIEAGTTPKFRAGKALRESVNGLR